MALTMEQVKGRIRNKARENGTDARLLLRIYMMERFLERISVSSYKDNFILKGGILVTSMIGIERRSTMDIDTSLKNLNLSEEDFRRVVEEVSAISLNDGITFRIKDITNIMDNMEYPGIRITMDAIMDKMVVPLKIDFSSGDIITPHEVSYAYKLLLEDRTIRLLSYNLETILAEKLQTVLARGVLNTRMRDFYDLHILQSLYSDSLDEKVFTEAFEATSKKRDSLSDKDTMKEILSVIQRDQHMRDLWKQYQKKFSYASDITYYDVIESTGKLLNIICLSSED